MITTFVKFSAFEEPGKIRTPAAFVTLDSIESFVMDRGTAWVRTKTGQSIGVPQGDPETVEAILTFLLETAGKEAVVSWDLLAEKIETLRNESE